MCTGPSAASSGRAPGGGATLSGRRGSRTGKSDEGGRDDADRSGKTAKSMGDGSWRAGLGADVRKPCISGMVRGRMAVGRGDEVVVVVMGRAAD
jgi:hypothetical protein